LDSSQGKALSLWDSYGLTDYQLRSGSFSDDSRGRWYLNVTVDVKQPVKTVGTSSVGIDLALKYLAALSNGQMVDAKQFYRDLELAHSVAQRAGHKRPHQRDSCQDFKALRIFSAQAEHPACQRTWCNFHL
jgi:putative transposase